jgi:LuxR family transcriptional regulator, quorum-sensing system regulator BjaR1
VVGATLNAQALDCGQYAFDAVDRLERSATSAELSDCLANHLGAFGFTSFLIGLPEGDTPTFILNGWPTDWKDHYSREAYYKDDPIAAWCRRAVQPYEWSEVKIDVERSPRAMEVIHAGREFRRMAGFVVPICQLDGRRAAVTMCGEQPELDPNAKRAIHFISLYAYSRAAALRKQETADHTDILTEGEREVLSWTAAGKSAWEISVILDIAEATVVWRVKQASAKLKAVNKLQAVVNAIRTRQISV